MEQTTFYLEFYNVTLVVICNVTVACFSASSIVLTSIFFQLKQLYFTSVVLTSSFSDLQKCVCVCVWGVANILYLELYK